MIKVNVKQNKSNVCVVKITVKGTILDITAETVAMIKAIFDKLKESQRGFYIKCLKQFITNESSPFYETNQEDQNG